MWTLDQWKRDKGLIISNKFYSQLTPKEREEIAIIEKFLPKQMSETEIKEAVSGIIASVGATSVADLGKVMGVASKQLAGKADGKTISAIVKELLS